MTGADAATRKKSACDRIMDAAGRLFYQRGFHSVGIDTIIAESGVAKMTLYRHFPSKDHLIVAYLRSKNEGMLVKIDAIIAAAPGPADALIDVFAYVRKVATSPTCLGCTFQGAAAEFPARDHMVHQAAVEHKEAMIGRFRRLAEEARLDHPARLANQLFLLMDGAWAAARLYGPDNPALDLTGAAEALLGAAGRG